MAVRTRTLTNLLADVRWQADQLGATVRHDDSSLTRALNQSIQRFREWVSDNGFAYYLVPSTPGSLPVGATSPYAFGQLDISAVTPAVVRIYGLDVTVNGEIISLDPVAFGERNSFQHFEDSGGIPVAFSMYSNTKIAILPPSQSAYQYVLWYLPVASDLSSGSDTFDGIAGWEEWLVWDMLIKIIVRDDAPNAAQIALTERDRIQADILKRSRNLQRVGPMVKRDTRGEKAAKRAFAGRGRYP